MSRNGPSKKNVEILKMYLANKKGQISRYRVQEKRKEQRKKRLKERGRHEREMIDKKFKISMEDKSAWGHHVTYINDNFFLIEWIQLRGHGNIPGSRTIGHFHRYVDREKLAKWLRYSKNEFILSMI